MRLFLDCEWNEYQGDLISMALVGEDNRFWYEVLGCDDPKPWVAENVMPILNKQPISKAEFQESLRKWLCKFASVHVVADWPEDIAHFCNALIISSGKRIDTPPLTFEILRIKSVSTVPHNALHDAEGIRQAVLDSEFFEEVGT